jgi:glycosyltransferase involved in cell wall biosynthesis
MANYNIRILYDVPGWAYYWRAIALRKYAPPDFSVDIGPDYGKAFNSKQYHLVLQLAYSYAKQLRQFMSNSKRCNFPLVSSYNVGWGYANKWLQTTIAYSDYVIVNSFDMWNKSGRHPKTIHISNGVDLEVYKLKKPIKGRRPRVLWIGSIAHKKTKNYDKILVPLSQELRRRNIAVDFRVVDSVGRNRMTQDQMCYWYNTGSIYVVASSSEGTPNPALEAAACGCTVVATRVGNMPELIEHGRNGFLCDTTYQSVFQNVMAAIQNQESLATNMQQTIQPWHWKNRANEYYSFFRKIIEARK